MDKLGRLLFVCWYVQLAFYLPCSISKSKPFISYNSTHCRHQETPLNTHEVRNQHGGLGIRGRKYLWKHKRKRNREEGLEVLEFGIKDFEFKIQIGQTSWASKTYFVDFVRNYSRAVYPATRCIRQPSIFLGDGARTKLQPSYVSFMYCDLVLIFCQGCEEHVEMQEPFRRRHQVCSEALFPALLPVFRDTKYHSPAAPTAAAVPAGLMEQNKCGTAFSFHRVVSLNQRPLSSHARLPKLTKTKRSTLTCLMLGRK